MLGTKRKRWFWFTCPIEIKAFTQSLLMSELEMCRNSKSWEVASIPGKGPHMTLGNRRNFGLHLGEEGGRPVCRSLPQTSPKGRGGRGTRQPPLQASGGRAGGITPARTPAPSKPPSQKAAVASWVRAHALSACLWCSCVTCCF